jgi:hypothetical protein
VQIFAQPLNGLRKLSGLFVSFHTASAMDRLKRKAITLELLLPLPRLQFNPPLMLPVVIAELVPC